MKTDKRYEKQINKLIPAAVKDANESVRGIGKQSEMRTSVDGRWLRVHCFFTEYFHKAMNRMAREAGLRP